MRVINQLKTTVLYEIHSGKVFISQYNDEQKAAIQALHKDGYLRLVSDNFQLTDKALNIVHFQSNYEDFLEDERILQDVIPATIPPQSTKAHVGIGLFKKLSKISITNIIEMIIAGLIIGYIVWYFGYNTARQQAIPTHIKTEKKK
jgi:hypothetical protein